MLNKVRNLFGCRWGWSFRAVSLTASRRVVHEGEAVTLSAGILNDGFRLGTVYAQFEIADSYQHDRSVFNSDRDLSSNERFALRLVDIRKRETRSVSCPFVVPSKTSFMHFDIRLQVWNPHPLFNGPDPWKFSDTGWVGGFEVVSAGASPANVFISYSWDSPAHQGWVQQLAEELRKYSIGSIYDKNDLHPGEEATLFMERGISTSRVTVLVCTEVYTNKANLREPGGVGYETIVSAHEYMLRKPEERARFIPIVRNNDLPKGRKLPTYLGSAFYIDMSGPDWHAKPMLDLVNAIRCHL